MAKYETVNQYKVTVISKYKDFDGTERESKTSKMVYAKSENGARNQVTKVAKKLVRQPKEGTGKVTEQWNDRASQFVNDQNITVELIKEGINVLT